MAAEGWFKDPFAVHDARWFSAGTPTDLVKDGSTEMSDPPPDRAIAGRLEPVARNPVPGPFVVSTLPEGDYDAEAVFRVNSARGCFSILGLWIANVGLLVLFTAGLTKTRWAWVAIGIQVTVLVVLLIVRYIRGGRGGLRLWRRT
jgi:hypothetical protein